MSIHLDRLDALFGRMDDLLSDTQHSPEPAAPLVDPAVHEPIVEERVLVCGCVLRYTASTVKLDTAGCTHEEEA